MKNQKIGVAMTGSFCTFSQVLPVIRQLARSNEVTVVLSPAAAETDTRFYRAEDLLRELDKIDGPQAHAHHRGSGAGGAGEAL